MQPEALPLVRQMAQVLASLGVAMSQNTACWAVVAWLAAQAPLSLGPAVL